MSLYRRYLLHSGLVGINKLTACYSKSLHYQQTTKLQRCKHICSYNIR